MTNGVQTQAGSEGAMAYLFLLLRNVSVDQYESSALAFLPNHLVRLNSHLHSALILDHQPHYTLRYKISYLAVSFRCLFGQDAGTRNPYPAQILWYGIYSTYLWNSPRQGRRRRESKDRYFWQNFAKQMYSERGTQICSFFRIPTIYSHSMFVTCSASAGHEQVDFSWKVSKVTNKCTLKLWSHGFFGTVHFWVSETWQWNPNMLDILA